jgi:hypothetical protein
MIYEIKSKRNFVFIVYKNIILVHLSESGNLLNSLEEIPNA